MIPHGLHILSLLALLCGLLSAIIIAVDEMRRPQHMWIMNIVWPVNGLFAGVLAVWAYYKYGLLATKHAVMEAKERGEEMPNKRDTPFPAMVAKGAMHCGSGCCLGDICAEWLAFFLPAVAVWLGWQSLFQEKIFAVWILDYCFAFVLGVAFQYFTIKPMRDLSPGAGLLQAVKADAASLTAWQVGMYGFMALAHFWIFKHLLGAKLEVNTAAFWFMMQLAMLCGFATSYPVNWVLIRAGVKEKM